MAEFSINERINILFNYIYKNDTSVYEYIPIDIEHIVIDDLKTTQKILISEFLSYKFELVEFINNDSVKLKLTTKSNKNAFVTISNYNKYSDINNVLSKEYISTYLRYIFSELQLKNISNYTTLPICSFDLDVSKLIELSNNVTGLDVIIQNCSNSNYKSIVYVEIYECFYNPISLKNYLMSDNVLEINIKHIFYQIINAIIIFQREYPNYRHNNLTLDTIFVLSSPDFKNGVLIKIDNFTKSYYPHKFSQDHNLSIYNRYADLHYFLNTFINKPEYKDISATLFKKFRKFEEFISYLIPKKLMFDRENKDNYYIIAQDGLHEHILPDKIFAKYPYIINDELSQPRQSLQTDIIDTILESDNTINTDLSSSILNSSSTSQSSTSPSSTSPSSTSSSSTSPSSTSSTSSTSQSSSSSTSSSSKSSKSSNILPVKSSSKSSNALSLISNNGVSGDRLYAQTKSGKNIPSKNKKNTKDQNNTSDFIIESSATSDDSIIKSVIKNQQFDATYDMDNLIGNNNIDDIFDKIIDNNKYYGYMTGGGCGCDSNSDSNFFFPKK